MNRCTTGVTMAVTLLAASLAVASPQTRPAAPGAKQPTPGAKSEKKTAKVGEKAPAFTLMDAAGKAYSLADYKGRTVVLQWINPDCPVCRGVMEDGRVASMVRELTTLDPKIVHLAINTTHYMEAEKSAAYMKGHKMAAPALIDRDGTVGRLYDARTTPHLYVIDGEGVLRYSGAIDNARVRGGEGETMNYVVNAVRQMKAGETIAPDKTRAYGCSVKYAKGKGQGQGKERGRRSRGQR